MTTPTAAAEPRGRPVAPVRGRASDGRRTVGAAVVMVVAAAVLASACGRGGTGSPTTPAPSPATTRPAGPTPTPVATPVALAAVACGSPTSCVAVDAQGRAHGWDGTRWAAPQPATAQPLGPGTVAASCAGPGSCQLVTTGSDAVTPWNGTTFGGPATLPGANGITALGCAPDGYCAAVDAEGYAFALRGGSWSGTSGDWGAATGLACVSSTFCVSVSGGISTWDGASWTTPAPMGASSTFAGVSCPSASSCTAVDRGGEALSWNGTAWSPPTRIEPAGSGATLGPSPTAVSCATPTVCVVVDDAGGLVAGVAGRWTRTVVDPGHRLTGVACPSPSRCVVTDDRGAALVVAPTGGGGAA